MEETMPESLNIHPLREIKIQTELDHELAVLRGAQINGWRIIRSVQIPAGRCEETLLPSLLKAGLVHSGDYSRPAHSDNIITAVQTHDILIYVGIIVVFYALVVLVVLGARCRRSGQPRFLSDPVDEDDEEIEDPRHLVVYDPDRDIAIQASSHDTTHAQHYSGKPV
ncbi:unnamed protein product [Notodromas monacha]|uniref:Uncharacterized protein n=1 Tax=Notodromas monacha TaxID=399045 RepID=A0A7R9BD42_9CRUS|nr:unnamed protein product [Notodromas monacha]CAG0913156.1 unnamed protein product [Notodromas monacha]